MRKSTPIYVKIYEDLRLRFFCAAYQKGDRFPSCATLCKEYGVSDRTMRQAVHLLVENGFIATEKRKAPVVIYECGRQTVYPAPALSARELAELLDIVDTMDLVLPALLLHCMPLCDGEDRARLASILKGMSENLDSPGIFVSLAKSFSGVIVEKGRNRLMQSFFDRQKPLEGLFHATGRSARAAYLAFLTDILGRMEAGKGLEQIDYHPHNVRFREMVRSLYHAGAGASEQPAEQGLTSEVSLYQSVYLDLLRRVQEEEFQKGDYLPSRARLCKQYGVSGITAAHAVRKLREMGVAEAVPGRGVRLLLSGERLGETFDRKLLVMQARRFMEGMEMLALTCENAAGHAVEQMDQLEALSLYRRIDSKHRKATDGADTQTCLPGLLLRFVIDRIQYRLLQDLYKKIEEDFYMAFQFAGLLPAPDRREKYRLTRMCLEIAGALADGRRKEFARSMAELYWQIYRLFILACRERGIWDEVNEAYELSVGTLNVTTV